MRLLEAVGLRTKELLEEKKMSQYKLIKVAKFNEKTIQEKQQILKLHQCTESQQQSAYL